MDKGTYMEMVDLAVAAVTCGYNNRLDKKYKSWHRQQGSFMGIMFTTCRIFKIKSSQFIDDVFEAGRKRYENFDEQWENFQ